MLLTVILCMLLALACGLALRRLARQRQNPGACNGCPLRAGGRCPGSREPHCDEIEGGTLHG